MTRRITSAALVVVVLAGAGCGRKSDSAALQVRNVMRATARLSRAVVYTDTGRAGVVEVRARIEDDLRYKASVTVDGTRVLDEVVVDDALADRVLDPRAFTVLGATSVNASLLTGDWIVDKYGAPSILPADTSNLRPGDDAILDALTVFRHVDRAINDAGGVHRFDPDSLTYRPREDPFPRPDHGAGEVRYDLSRLALPRPNAGGNASRIVPGPQHFRKLSLYVLDGRVVRILEQIDLTPRLRDLERLYALGLDPRASTAARAAQAVMVLNQARRVTGGEPIRPRYLDVRITEAGRAVMIDLPADAKEASLTGLPHRGDREATHA